MNSKELWLSDYFSSLPNCPIDAVDLKANFFEAGYIDSFGAIALIDSIENNFNIRFSEVDFLDRRFPTIAGLAQIILERSGNGQ